MASISDEFGADARVVASMQYVQGVCVAMVGALLRYWLGPNGRSAMHAARAPLQSFSPFNLLLTIVTLLTEISQGKRLSTGALLMQVLRVARRSDP